VGEMSNQEILNKASMEYIKLSEEVKKMVREAKREKEEKEILANLDILIQLMLMYVAVSDYSVDNIEVSFIKLFKTERDIIDFYNEKNLKKITWDDLKEENMEPTEFKEFVDRSYKMFYQNINHFIIFLASIDSLTKDNELSIVENYIRNILTLFDQIDNKTSDIVDYVMNEMLISKYKQTKSIFSSVDFKL
jgi:hypothetical protein